MSRISRLRQVLQEEKIANLLVTNIKNVRYLSGFTGSTALILITPQHNYFITDFRYTEQAKTQAKDFEVIIHTQGLYPTVNELLVKESKEALAIEAEDMNVATFNLLSKTVANQLVATSRLIEKIREVKDATEIALIKQACEITDAAFDHILNFIQVGMTEMQVANEMERFVKEAGSTGASFDTIIASGHRSAMPHGVASTKIIESGDLVTIDFGCYYNGYTSDMTRTIGVGKVAPQLREIYDIVLEAHERVNRSAKAGMTGQEVDQLARDYITEKGYGPQFGHSTGHGIGLDVHEGPAIASRNTSPLVINNVITNEPGIYIEGLGGVRIEDDLLVLADGVESLNHSPKSFINL